MSTSNLTLKPSGRRKSIDELRADHRERYRLKQLNPIVSVDRLRELLIYSPETGVFVYRSQRGRFQEGDIAGTICHDLGVDICVDGRLYRAHRLAWLYMTGEWPEFEIDHRDINPSNNKWENLRDVTSTVNKQNMRKAPKGKKYSPLLGAHWCKQASRWKSAIKINGHLKFLGFFKSDVEAHDAYVIAKRVFHEGCTI